MHNILHTVTNIVRKPIVIIVIILLVIGLGVWNNVHASSKKAQYQTAQVQKNTIISTVTENGNVASTSQANVGSPTTGVVTEIDVKDGDTVAAGQNLFKVKSIATAQEIASAYANYLSAQNNLQSAQAKMNSLQASLFVANQAFINDRGVNNPSDQQKADPKYVEENATWLQAEADYKDQLAVIAQAQAALNNASLSYQATQNSIITAPLGGTVANLSVKVGDQVTASAGNLSSENTSSTSSSAGSAILSIGNFANPYVKVQASEVDIPNIQAGQKATITLNAFTAKTFVGTVDQVDTVGSNTSGVITYNVFVSFIAPPNNIKPGMSAAVTIQTARHDNVVTVPSAAIQTTGGQTTVRVLTNGTITSVPVETGITSDTDTEITSGLTEGQTVVTGVSSAAAQSTAAGSSPFSGSLRGGFGGGVGGGARTGGGTRGG